MSLLQKNTSLLRHNEPFYITRALNNHGTKKNVLVYEQIFVFSRLKQKYLKFAHLFPLKLGLPTADHCKLKNRAKFERKTADAISMFTTISMGQTNKISRNCVPHPLYM